MKILGVIVEYNPFHNGHLLHLNESIKVTDSTHTVAVMSGNFLQRGEPAIIDKHSRAAMAVKSGVDLVLELPSLYACQSAELFAKGSISILNSINCVDSLSFGSELGDLDTLYKISNIIAVEPLMYKSLLKDHLSMGMTFPSARAKAISVFMDLDKIGVKVEDIMNNSNNILALEYLKSIIKSNSKIKPYTIQRVNSSYNSKSITGDISSATAIRTELFKNNNLDELKNTFPHDTYEILNEIIENNFPLMCDEYFFDVLKTIIIRDGKLLNKYHEVNEGIENKIYSEIFSSNSLEELIDSVKSKRYTRTKIKRILNNILLGITREEIEIAKSIDEVPYVRVLAFNDKGREILKRIKDESDVVIVNKFSNVDFHLDDIDFKTLIECDIRSSNIYNSIYYKNKKINYKGSFEYYSKPIYVKDKK